MSEAHAREFAHGCIAGCRFLPEPEFAGFNWGVLEFRFAGADNADLDSHSRVLEQTPVD